jgi:hypothetical protein
MMRRTFLAGMGALFGAQISSPVVASARNRTLLVAGQSLALQWRDPAVQAGYWDTAGPMWDIVVVGRGGSSAMPLAPNNWWLDVRSGEIGPAMKQALADMRSVHARPDVVLWSQGQADGDRFGRLRMSPEEFVGAYITTVRAILHRLRRECGGSGWRDIPVMIQTIGWRKDPLGNTKRTQGYDLIRHAQQVLISSYGHMDNIIPGPTQSPWCDLVDAVHPTISEATKMARIAGMLVKGERL